MNDKNVWVKWMEKRAHGECDVIETPIGLLPTYADLKPLFKSVLGEDYSEEDYAEQFTIRVPQNLEKIDRIEEIYRTQVADTPDVVFEELQAERERLQAAQKEHGDYIDPRNF
jgi:phosphoenolpyruvate carboxykinase (GTP)